MKLSQNEQALLNLLADEWEKSGPPGYIETSLIAQRLGVSVADEVDTFAAYLTPEGYELARKSEDDNAAG